ncbi:hypothetical protein CFP56_020295 [Quercus suber]|uniref:Uncharacterized protein n=1 Tax=Quercus suber TaxID=58331 RepID=A0AAW0KFQ0_QUESU
MENHEVWSKQQIVCIEPAKLSTCYYLVAFQSSDIMLMKGDSHVMHYNFRSGNSKMSNVQISPLENFPFHSDFELETMHHGSMQDKQKGVSYSSNEYDLFNFEPDNIKRYWAMQTLFKILKLDHL